MAEIVTEKELQKRLSVSRNLIWKWRKKGMPVIRMGYRTIRYDYQTVLEWIVQQFDTKPTNAE